MDGVVANYVVDHLRDSVAPGAIPRPGVERLTTKGWQRTAGDIMATDTAKSPTAAPSPNARPGLTLEAGDVQARVEASDVQAISGVGA
jgi:hypothetical protein